MSLLSKPKSPGSKPKSLPSSPAFRRRNDDVMFRSCRGNGKKKNELEKQSQSNPSSPKGIFRRMFQEKADKVQRKVDMLAPPPLQPTAILVSPTDDDDGEVESIPTQSPFQSQLAFQGMSKIPFGGTSVESGYDSDGSRSSIQALRSSPSANQLEVKIKLKLHPIHPTLDRTHSYPLIDVFLKRRLSVDKAKSQTVPTMYENIARPENLPLSPVSRTVMRYLAPLLPKWKFPARDLGLKGYEIETISANNPNEVTEQCYRMLETWKQRYPESCNYRRLGEVLWEDTDNFNVYPKYIEVVKRHCPLFTDGESQTLPMMHEGQFHNDDGEAVNRSQSFASNDSLTSQSSLSPSLRSSPSANQLEVDIKLKLHPTPPNLDRTHSYPSIDAFVKRRLSVDKAKSQTLPTMYENVARPKDLPLSPRFVANIGEELSPTPLQRRQLHDSEKEEQKESFATDGNYEAESIHDSSKPDIDLLTNQHTQSQISHILHDIFKQRKFVYTGEESQLLWEEYGINVHFPPSHPPTHVEGTISVLSPDDSYVIPEGCDLVSALYDISADQQLPVAVTVEIEHCVPIENNSEASALGMTHIIARNTPPYVFSEMTEEPFEPGSFYGKMQLDHFTGLGTVVRSIKWGLGRTIPFYGALYYFSDSSANFVVTKNLRAHISAVREQYCCAVREVGIPIRSNRHSLAVELEIPDDHEWKITPSFKPTHIIMDVVQEYQPGKAIPQILLKMKWTGEGAAVERDISIGLSGVSSPNSFTLTCSPRENVAGGKAESVKKEPASPTFPAGDDRPTLDQLTQLIDRDGRTHRILETIAPKWEELAHSLGFPHAVVQTVAKNHPHDARAACEEMMGQWLAGREDTRPPTWAALTETLRDCDMVTLALDIDSALD